MGSVLVTAIKAEPDVYMWRGRMADGPVDYCCCCCCCCCMNDLSLICPFLSSRYGLGLRAIRVSLALSRMCLSLCLLSFLQLHRYSPSPVCTRATSSLSWRPVLFFSLSPSRSMFPWYSRMCLAACRSYCLLFLLGPRFRQYRSTADNLQLTN